MPLHGKLSYLIHDGRAYYSIKDVSNALDLSKPWDFGSRIDKDARITLYHEGAPWPMARIEAVLPVVEKSLSPNAASVAEMIRQHLKEFATTDENADQAFFNRVMPPYFKVIGSVTYRGGTYHPVRNIGHYLEMSPGSLFSMISKSERVTVNDTDFVSSIAAIYLLFFSPAPMATAWLWEISKAAADGTQKLINPEALRIMFGQQYSYVMSLYDTADDVRRHGKIPEMSPRELEQLQQIRSKEADTMRGFFDSLAQSQLHYDTNGRSHWLSLGHPARAGLLPENVGVESTDDMTLVPYVEVRFDLLAPPPIRTLPVRSGSALPPPVTQPKADTDE